VFAINDWDYRNRMGSLYAFDDLVASVVSELESEGVLDNTYLVFAGDNGYQLGAHRLIQKMAPYEESVRVPLVIAGPGVPAGQVDQMTLLTDVAPTILDLAGVTVPADVDGVSLAPLLRGADPSTWRTDFVGAYASSGQDADTGIAQELIAGLATKYLDVPRWQALRTQDHLYVEWPQHDGSTERELYDLRSDPYQMTNLVATPDGLQAHQDLVDRLAARLTELSACSGATCRS
jgi:arylsulfatase A-like enzyme